MFDDDGVDLEYHADIEGRILKATGEEGWSPMTEWKDGVCRTVKSYIGDDGTIWIDVYKHDAKKEKFRTFNLASWVWVPNKKWEGIASD